VRIGINAISRRLQGGTRTYLTNLLPGLLQDQLNSEILVWHNECDISLVGLDEGRYRSFQVSAAICENYIRRMAFEQCELVRQCRRSRVDLLFSAVSGTSVIARGLGLPTVAIVHQSLPELLSIGYYYGAAKFLRQRYMQGFTKLASRTIVPSMECAKSVQRIFNVPADKLAVIYHGGAGAQFRPIPLIEALPRAEELLGTGKYVLAVSDLYPYKNFRNLIRAFASLVKQYGIRHDLVIVGKADEGNYVEKLIAEAVQQKLEKRVRLIAGLNYEDLPAVYSAATLFVNPSTVESFGLPQLEAMACGTPVVASRTSVMPEICGDAALYFDPANPIEMASVIHRVLGNETIRAELQQKGLHRAKLFSWERTAHETIDLFAKLVTSGGG